MTNQSSKVVNYSSTYFQTPRFYGFTVQVWQSLLIDFNQVLPGLGIQVSKSNFPCWKQKGVDGLRYKYGNLVINSTSLWLTLHGLR